MSKSECPTIRLKAKEERRIKGGHLWIFSNEIQTQEVPITDYEPGTEVIVEEHSGKPLGRGYLNPHSLICCRLLTRNCRQNIDAAFLKKRMQRALSLRQQAFSTHHYRAIYGDSDGLSGLVVDRFGDYLVAQLNTAGMERLKSQVLDALLSVFHPKAVLWRNDSPLREQEGLPQLVEVAYGDWPETLMVTENGVDFEVSSISGQKTGWFYDHRDNRRQLMTWVQGKRVLDVFAYVGGWGLQAMAAGAESLTAVDASEAALDQLVANADKLGCGDKVTCVEGNGFEVLEALLEAGERFDVVVVDPPAFIKRKKDFKAGLNAYKKLNTLAMRLLPSDGILVSASCSMHLPRETLVDTVRGVSRHVDRYAQLVYSGGQGADHPVHPAIVETDYLKACFFSVGPAL